VTPTPPKGNDKAGWVAPLALVMAILGAGVSIYTWYVTQVAGQLEVGRELGRLDGMSREVDRLVDSQSELQAKVDAALSRSLEDKRELLEKMDAAQAAMNARLQALADEQAGAIAQQDDEISSLAGVVAATRSQIGAVHEDWLLREVAHLLLLANQRLTLLGDTDLAKRALTLADDRLRAFADPGILEVRRALSQELSALDQLDSTDLSGIALDLGSLVQTVSTLPLKGDDERPDWTTASHNDGRAESVVPASSAETQEPGFFSTLMGRVSDDLGSLVRVRRVDETQLPKLDNSERFLAYENLRLHLLVAQLALLRSDQPLYQENLAKARSWLSGYFEPSSATLRFDAQLSEMMQVQVAQDIPDISASLTLLRSEIGKRDQAE
jgi:uroporphyrin-3 C-methyltransferase